MLDQTEIATICISAVVHDLDHPGFTNPFLCNNRAQLALLYNDKYGTVCVCVDVHVHTCIL